MPSAVTSSIAIAVTLPTIALLYLTSPDPGSAMVVVVLKLYLNPALSPCGPVGPVGPVGPIVPA